MLWSLVKSWAKNHGYETLKDKGDEEKGEKVQYYWAKKDNMDICGVESSVSKLAKAIYNNITNNQWVEHQIQFKQQSETKFSVSDYGS